HSLDQLLPSLAHIAGRGLNVNEPALQGALRGLGGIVDRPFEQRRDPLWLGLSAAQGDVLVGGGPQNGTSTLLRTPAASLALTHTPAEVQFYGLDLSGGALGSLAALPHMGCVAARRDVNRVRRTIAEIHALLQEREARFASAAIDSIATY